jgi:hypothetical protein
MDSATGANNSGATRWREIIALNCYTRARVTLLHQWYNHCSRLYPMQNGGTTQTGMAGNNIRFDCPHCSAPLVFDATSAVKSLDCNRCKKSVRIPRTLPPVATAQTTTPPPTGRPSTPPTRLPPIAAATTVPPRSSNLENDAVAELKRQLKENQSQRTEVTGHINQLNIQLHRWQLRLNTLNERQKELESRIAAGKGSSS